MQRFSLSENFLQVADQNMPFTDEEELGTFYEEWAIPNWSSVGSEQLYSPIFKTNDQSWRVLMFPKGNDCPGQLSLYLENKEYKDDTSLTDGVCAQAVFCIVDPTDSTKFACRGFQHRFTRFQTDQGFKDYVSLDNLVNVIDNESPLIQNDTLVVAVIIRLINDPTGVLWHDFVDYDSKAKTGYVGLYNQGATCYMNSLFQSLFFTNAYRKAVYQIPTENDQDPSSSMALALQRLFFNIQFSNSAVSTTELTQSFGWNSIDSFMQHDVQEFNRLLQDTIEKKMKGTPADGAISQLFVGRMKSYIRCINVNYESSRSETYYDIQLNVKGCKDLKQSFENYVLEETLKGDNKYMAEGFGLQDAKKGVIFESFPPVLHLQLKRFEYDMQKETMVKINDRHEFPTEIDLKPYLDNSAAGENHNYILHGVLVHKGDLSGGHYFAFVKPAKENQWFKFDDDRVTPSTLKQALENNYGGKPAYGGKEIQITTNAYMLVYIRESLQDEILSKVTQDHIPKHLAERFFHEQLIKDQIEKQKAEQHLYMKAYIVTDTSFLMNQGVDWVQFNETVQEASSPVEVVSVLRSQTLGEFLDGYSLNHNIGLHKFRPRIMVSRKNGSLRPDIVLEKEWYSYSLQDICQRISNYPFIRFYMESTFDSTLTQSDQSNATLIFVKLFDHTRQSLCGLGKMYVSRDILVVNIQDELNEMAGFKKGTDLVIYEEVNAFDIIELDLQSTFEKNQVTHDGDILCIQTRLDKELELTIQQNLSCVTVPEYYSYLLNRIPVLFEYKDDKQQSDHDMFELELRKDMLYEEITCRLAQHLKWDSQSILLIVPAEKPYHVRPYPNLRLNDIFYFPLSRQPKLYFKLLEKMTVEEWEKKNQITVHVCYTKSLYPFERIDILMGKAERTSQAIKVIQNKFNITGNMRLFQVKHYKVLEVLDPDRVIEASSGTSSDLFAEIKPEEELNMNKEDFFIPVFHFQHEIHLVHSIPFMLLVIKDEPFGETKKRLQARTGLSNQEFGNVQFTLISKFVKHIKEDNFKLSDHKFDKDEALGLDHTDPFQQQNIIAERGLFIKEN